MDIPSYAQVLRNAQVLFFILLVLSTSVIFWSIYSKEFYENRAYARVAKVFGHHDFIVIRRKPFDTTRRSWNQALILYRRQNLRWAEPLGLLIKDQHTIAPYHKLQGKKLLGLLSSGKPVLIRKIDEYYNLATVSAFVKTEIVRDLEISSHKVNVLYLIVPPNVLEDDVFDFGLSPFSYR